MKRFRTIFMGTPDFAVPCLARLAQEHDVIGVYTQPDKPRGRGQKLTPSPVKAWAEAHGIPVFQPERVKTAEAVAGLKSLAPELIVVVAFGQILSQEILDIPPQGCINVHASLLPRYRGAAPMQWCLIDGVKKSGVTTMHMDAGLDTGDMLLQRELAVGPDMTLAELHDALSVLGAQVLSETLQQMAAGTLVRTPQTGESNYAPMMTKETGHIDWTKTPQAIHNLVRGLNSWPGAYAFLAGKKYKVWRTLILDDSGEKLAPGTVAGVDANGINVAAGDGTKRICITELQAPGKKKMAAADYLRGHSLAADAVFE